MNLKKIKEIVKLKSEIDKIEDELQQDTKYYMKKYKDILLNNKNIEKIINNIEEKCKKNLLVKIEQLNLEYINKMKNFNYIYKLVKYINKKMILNNFLSETTNDKYSLCFNEEEQKFFYVPEIYKLKEYIFSSETIGEYITKTEDNRVCFTKKGKEMIKILTCRFNGTQFLQDFKDGWNSEEEEGRNYIITRNGKFFDVFNIAYNDKNLFSSNFLNDRLPIKIIEKTVKTKSNICGGLMRKGGHKPVCFLYSLNDKISYTLNNFLNFESNQNKNNYLKLKKEYINKFKKIEGFCTIFFDDSNEICYSIQRFDENNFIILQYNFDKDENIIVENFLTKEKIKLDKLIEYEEKNNIDEMIKELLYNEIEKPEELDRFNIMIVGGNWSEDSRKKVFKDYNATFVSLEEYERYSEKSKNADYIFIDTSANTHSNTYKAKSIHDNVKLISRSKKGEIDKWIK